MCGDWAESVGLRYGSTLVQAREATGGCTTGTLHDDQEPAEGDRSGTLGGDAPAARAEPRRSLSAVEGRMTQRLVWPADLQRQEDGSILVSFPDIPEALTEGATEAEALVEAQDCVIAALGGPASHSRAVPGSRADVSRVAGAGCRQDCALRRDARAGRRQYRASGAARA